MRYSTAREGALEPGDVPDAAEVAARLRDALEAPLGPDAAADLAADVDALFAAHQDYVYTVARRLMRHPQRVPELAQEALVRAFERLHTYEGRARFRSWLYGITRNLAWNAQTKRKEALTEDGLLDPSDAGTSMLTSLRRHEREELLRAAAAAVLDPLEQEAVHLRYVEGLGQAAISDVLGLESASGARGLLQRCRRKLGRELRRRLEELGQGSSLLQVTM